MRTDYFVANNSAAVLLDAAGAVGAGASFPVAGFNMFTFYVEASGVTTGATVKIQARAPSGNWIDIDSRVITANGNYVVNATAVFNQIRANITAWTDGAYTISTDFMKA